MKTLAHFTSSLCLLLTTTLSHAATLTPSLDDANAVSNGTVQEVANYQSRIGEYYGNGSSYVMPFLLPTLAVDEAFDTASLRFQLFGKDQVSPLANADLYGLSARTASTVLGTDYYSGLTADPSATLIKADILDSSMALGVYTDTSISSSLASYLNTQYAGGANAGKYVFLRFSYKDTPPLTNTAYAILTQDAGGATERPEFTYSVVNVAPLPEPSALGLAILGLAAVCGFRRRVTHA